MENKAAQKPGRRTNSWEKNPSKAFVYDPSSHKLSTDYLSTLDKTENFEIDLPWWRNTVDIYVDSVARTGFVATVRLDKLSTKKNWQRRLRQNYTVLRVKGLKPGEKGG
ncbi:MAG: hypothetical protein HETSPECPRED_005084 [Heterodermia speciosa]|uniref:Uncharacterized protein n=1 Tax=Heterodermia speciosa TaxID=116794 RepID=A0A8H3J792_9LECA|nr:MAG: hypothetical protein HETSPECPRED_005084 [Heterodermia speciosa]